MNITTIHWAVLKKRVCRKIQSAKSEENMELRHNIIELKVYFKGKYKVIICLAGGIEEEIAGQGVIWTEMWDWKKQWTRFKEEGLKNELRRWMNTGNYEGR